MEGSVNMKIGEKTLAETREDGRFGVACVGAGGEAGDWMTGIAEELEKEHIIGVGSLDIWEDAWYISGNKEEGGATVLILIFKRDGMEIDISKLSMWRVSRGENVKWIDDFCNNCKDWYEVDPKAEKKRLAQLEFSELVDEYLQTFDLWRMEMDPRNLEKLCSAIGYKQCRYNTRYGDPIGSFLSDNSGAQDMIVQWIKDNPCDEWKEELTTHLVEKDDDDED